MENGNGNEDLLVFSRRKVGFSQKGIWKKYCWIGGWSTTLKTRILMGTGFIFICILFGLTASCLFRNPVTLRYPSHASCNITWTLSQPCNAVTEKLLQQIGLWKTNETCGAGQKCLYKLESIDGNNLTATHKTPGKPYEYELLFNFYPSSTGGCHVTGYSTSRTWPAAVLDSGTNYCNLHNLVAGAGLQRDKIYSELTRDEICTQYTGANCEKF